MFKYLNSSFYYSSGTSVELFTFGVTIIEKLTLKISVEKKVKLKVLPQMEFLKTNICVFLNATCKL